MRVHPYLSFNGQCEEAFRFYEKTLGGKIQEFYRYEGSPMAKDAPPEWSKKIIHVTMIVDNDVLCTLFERLADTSEQAKVNFLFVLGLILMRKRLVIYETTRSEEGRDVWVVRLKGREDRLDLVDPKLSEGQVAEVSQQLGEILNEEL